MSKFCVSCGSSLNGAMFCARCGAASGEAAARSYNRRLCLRCQQRQCRHLQGQRLYLVTKWYLGRLPGYRKYHAATDGRSQDSKTPVSAPMGAQRWP
jgi:hypothetical protein